MAKRVPLSERRASNARVLDVIFGTSQPADQEQGRQRRRIQLGRGSPDKSDLIQEALDLLIENTVDAITFAV